MITASLRFGFVVVTATSDTRLRTHTHILLDEVLSRKVIHKVFRCDDAAVLIILLHNDLFELFTNNLHNLTEFEVHRFVLESADILVELLVEFLDHSRAPRLDLVIDEVDSLRYYLGLVGKLPIILKLLVQLVQLRSELGLRTG